MGKYSKICKNAVLIYIVVNQMKITIYKPNNVISCIILPLNTNLTEYLSKNHSDYLKFIITSL